MWGGPARRILLGGNSKGKQLDYRSTKMTIALKQGPIRCMFVWTFLIVFVPHLSSPEVDPTHYDTAFINKPFRYLESLYVLFFLLLLFNLYFTICPFGHLVNLVAKCSTNSMFKITIRVVY